MASTSMINAFLADILSRYTTLPLEKEFFGNTVLAYSEALIIFVVLVVFFKVFQWLLLIRLAALAERTKTDIDDTLIRIVRSLRPAFYWFVALFFALKFLSLTDMADQVLETLFLVFIVYQVIKALQILIDYVLAKKVATEGGAEEKGMLTMIGNIFKWSLWVLGALLILSNLGVDITSLIAGLGIGGLAIALALQNVLTDLFSSFSIYFDKPFKVGDFIVVGEHAGTVEKIGIKTTRIRALQGEEIVVSNKELTSARVQNFRKLEKRRVVFGLGVTYQTPNQKLETIPTLIKTIIEDEKDSTFDRASFLSFGDSALQYEIVYYVNSQDYNMYVEVQERLNLKIKEAFEREGIEMAYPTRTIYVSKA